MPFSYVSVSVLKGTAALNISGTAYDTRLRQIAEAVSTEIDRYTHRTFQPLDATYFYNGDNSTLLLIRDLISIGTVLEDDRNDGTFGVGWATADYMLIPRNATPTGSDGRPYTALMVSPKSNGTQDIFLDGPERYKVSGTWGYLSLLTDAGASASGSLSSTATTITVTTATIDPGWTILIDTERMYVQSTSGTSLTVSRGVWGSTAGTHASGTAINYYDYPSPIKEAALIQVARLWQRRNSGYASSVGVPELGIVTTFRGLDDDIKLLLNPYRKLL